MALFMLNRGSYENGNNRETATFYTKESMMLYANDLFEMVKRGEIDFASINDVYRSFDGNIEQGDCLVYVDEKGVRQVNNITDYSFRSTEEKLNY